MASTAFSPVRTTVLGTAAAEVTTGTGLAVDLLAATAITFYVQGDGTISTGVLTIEEATNVGYTGTWSAIGTIDLTTLSGGKQTAYHVGGPGGQFSYACIRPRITTNVTGSGGGVFVTLVAV